MGYLLDRAKQRLAEIRSASEEAPAPEPVQRGPALILDAIDTVERGKDVRDQWVDVCLQLADAIDWESVQLKPGWTVNGGAYGWKLFCSNANVTWLRDLAYPALIKKQDYRLPKYGR